MYVQASPRVDVDRLKWINKQHCDNLLSSSADSQPFISDLIACIVAEYGDRLVRMDCSHGWLKAVHIKVL